MCYFDLCNKIWGGSPATVQITSGLESTDLSPTPTDDGGEPSAVVPDVAGMTPEGPHDTEGDIFREEEETDPPMSQQPPDMDGAVQRPSNEDHDSSNQRRSLLNQQLAKYRHQKLKRKLLVDSQLLECAHEDLAVEQQMVEEMTKMDRVVIDNMAQLSQNVSQMALTVADAFASIRVMLLPQAQGPNSFYPSGMPFGAGPAPFPGPMHPPIHPLVYHCPHLSTSTSGQIHTPNDEPWPGADFEETN